MAPVIGLGFQSDKTAEEYIRLAQIAEASGIGVLSVYADFGYQPPILPLTLMARVTERVRLGPACLNPFSLAPHEIAGQIATLDLISQGRAYLGLARGTWLEGAGIRPDRPMTAMREAVEIFRRLLAHDDGGFEGEMFHLAAGIHLEYHPFRPDVPLMLGTWGPQTLTLAGEVADEVKIGGSANPDIVPWAREQIDRGSEQVGRSTTDVGICVGAVTVVDLDGEAARALARQEVAMYLTVVANLDPTFDVPSAVLEEVRAWVAQKEYDKAGKAIPRDVLDRFAFAGTPEEVTSQARRLFDAGATRIEFGTPHGLTNERGVRLIGERVVPAFR